MNYQDFIKKAVTAAVAGGGAYLTAKYSGRAVDVAVIAASVQVAVGEVEDLAKHDRANTQRPRTAVEPEAKQEEAVEPPIDSHPEHESYAIGIHF